MILTVPIFAQERSISGTVTDVAGEPLPGVTVMVEGTNTGTMTNMDGQYSLKAQPNSVLLFSFMGYVSQRITVTDQPTIDVKLNADVKNLQEVVVIGYGTQRREAVTGSVASMNGSTLREVSTGNVSTALAGRIAGVQMSQNNSQPGASMQIRIRGTRSLNADNNPLIVLDGIPFAGTIGDINPDDIKSIDILKDASATAIYGSRGANGVIIITTYKGGMGQKAKVTYSGYYGVKSLYHRIPMMTGDELYQLRKDAGIYKDTQGNPTMGSDEAQGTNTDWQGLMFKNSSVQNHDLGISGGTQSGSYSFGAGYYKDESLLPGQNFTRINLRASIDQNVGKYFRFGLTTNDNYNITNGQNIGIYNSLATSPLINPWNTDGTWKTIVHSVNDNVWAFSRDAINNLGDRWVDNQRDFGSYNSLYGELKIPYVDGLVYRVNLGLNLRNMNRGQYQGMGVFSDAPSAVSRGSLEKSQTYQWVIENLLTYDKTVGKHHINLTGLYSSEKTHFDRSLVSAINIPADFLEYWNLGQSAKTDVTVDPAQQKYEEYALQSAMGRIMYDFDGRYMLSVAVRTDGSSRLAPGYKWHTYPAISAGWNIAKENFMLGTSNYLDNLKLRLGWGQTSNQAVSPYATLGSLTLRPYNFGTTTTTNGGYVTSVPNASLGWEYSSTYNFGLDFSFFKNRLSGSVEYYIVNTNDLLMTVNLPSTSGVSSYWANIGKSQNKGFEMELNATIIKTKDLTWDAGVNFYTNANKIVSLASGTDRDEANAWFVGHPINSIFDYQKVGLWQTTDPDYKYLLPVTNVTPGYEPGGNAGMIKVKYTGTYNADGSPTRSIGAADRQIIDADPKWQGGFNTHIAYKNFEVSVIGTYQKGGILVSTYESSNGYLNMLTGRRGNIKVDYWTPDNTGAKYPKPGGVQSGDNPKYGSTLGYFDASYFKIGQITLGYNFDPTTKWFKTLGFSSARLYASVQNVFVLFSPFTKETGLDPVTNSYGNQNAAVTGSLPYNAATMLTVGTNSPQTRNFLLGLNLSF